MKDDDYKEEDAVVLAMLIMQCAADVTPEPVEWLWPGRVAAGKLTLIAGEPGLGKSQVSVAMAAAVTTGGEWPCSEGCALQGNVVILSAEDGVADTIVPRLMAAGADCEHVQIISAVKDQAGRRGFNLSADLKLLEQEITRLQDVRLVIIDPISSYLGPRVDSHVNASVRAVLEPVSEMAARLGIAIVAITHSPKGAGTAAIHRFIGSIAFVAAARAAFMVVPDPEDSGRVLFLPVKNNLAPLGKGLAFRLEQRLVGDPEAAIVASSVTWDDKPVTITADRALQAADEQAGGGRSGIDEAEEFLHNELRGGPAPVKDIKEAAAAHCISLRTLERAKRALGALAVKGGFDGDDAGWSWRLPDKQPFSAKGDVEDRQLDRRPPSQNWRPSGDLAPFDEYGGQSPSDNRDGEGHEDRQNSRRPPKKRRRPSGDLAAFDEFEATDGVGSKTGNGEASRPSPQPKAAKPTARSRNASAKAGGRTNGSGKAIEPKNGSPKSTKRPTDQELAERYAEHFEQSDDIDKSDAALRGWLAKAYPPDQVEPAFDRVMKVIIGP
jgi:putative DNA primase/helicase